MSAKHDRKPVPSVPACSRAIATVDARLVQAKHRISLAALACLRGAVDAPELVRQALEEVDRVRALLARAEGEDA